MIYNLIFFHLYKSLKDSSEKVAANRATGILAILGSLNVSFLLSIFSSIRGKQLLHYKIILAVIVLVVFIFHHFLYIRKARYKSISKEIENKQKQSLAKYLTVGIIVLTIIIATIAIII